MVCCLHRSTCYAHWLKYPYHHLSIPTLLKVYESSIVSSHSPCLAPPTFTDDPCTVITAQLKLLKWILLKTSQSQASNSDACHLLPSLCVGVNAGCHDNQFAHRHHKRPSKIIFTAAGQGYGKYKPGSCDPTLDSLLQWFEQQVNNVCSQVIGGRVFRIVLITVLTLCCIT